MSDYLPSPVVVVLAAGAGRRFRAAGGVGNKLQADLRGRSVLDWTLGAVRASGLPWVLVERPPQGADLLGMGDSIARGVAMHPEAPGWLILPGDLPLIQPASLRQVAHSVHAVVTTQPWVVVRPEVLHKEGPARPGHPVGFGPAWRSALLELQGDAGAIELVRTAAQQGTMQYLSSHDLGCIQDIDIPGDITQATRVLTVLPSFESICQDDDIAR